MLRLVEADVAGARNLQPGQKPPTFVRQRGDELDALPLELVHRLLDVLAHQVELVPARLRCGMDGELARRQREDQPAVVRIDVREREHVAEERPRGLGVLGEHDRVRAGDHGQAPSACRSSHRSRARIAASATAAMSSPFSTNVGTENSTSAPSESRCTRITRWSRRASTSKGRYDQPSTPGTSRCRSSPTRAAYGLVITHLPAFLGVAALVIVAPGPDTALTIRNTLRGGRRSGVLTGVGVVGGQTVWAIATAAGVAAL